MCHFSYMSMMVFRNVTTVLVVPLLLALLSRRFLPRFVDKVKSVKDLGFYMWCFNLTILMGETVRNFLHATVSGWILALLLYCSLGGMSSSVCHRQGCGTSLGCQHQCRTGFGSEEYNCGYLAHPYIPQSFGSRSSWCLCGMAEPGQWLATMV